MNFIQKAVAKAFNLQGKNNPSGVSDYSNVPDHYPWDWWQKGMKVSEINANTTVEACIGVISQTVAQLPLRHHKINKDGGHEIVKDSYVTKVLRKPNPYQTKSDFFLNFVRQVYLDGNGYAVATRGNNYQINALYPLQKMTPYFSHELKEVIYSGGSNEVFNVDNFFPSRDVLHTKLHTDANPLVGITPLVSATLSASTGNSIQGHENKFFKNMSRPSGTLTTDLTLTKDQIRILREVFEEQSKGMATGGIPILASGLKFESMSLNAVDAEIIETYKMTKQDIASVFRVPMSLIGSMDDATFNNVESLMKFWISSGLGFILDHIEASLNELFDLPDDEFLNFDTDYLLRSDFKSRIDGLTKGISGGLYTPNEARAKEGLPKVKNGDSPMLQAQMIRLEDSVGVDDPTPSTTPADEEVDAIKICKGVFND